jgi:hypothetical protein
MGKITNPPLITPCVEVNQFKKINTNPFLFVKLNKIISIYCSFLEEYAECICYLGECVQPVPPMVVI